MIKKFYKNIENKFQEWCKIKEKISKKEIEFFIHEWEIRWINMWKNVWFEQDWKWNEFLRPVLILRIYSKYLFLWIPLTTQIKDWNYFYNFKYKNKIEFDKIENVDAILIQARSFSKKRLVRYIWKIWNIDLLQIKNELRKLI